MTSIDNLKALSGPAAALDKLRRLLTQNEKIRLGVREGDDASILVYRDGYGIEINPALRNADGVLVHELLHGEGSL